MQQLSQIPYIADGILKLLTEINKLIAKDSLKLN